ncbi:hypothetical protein RJ55_08401 [Drechmeria coniospora]|nr:hypothetical protein RJ55_08401 [Drechmeria coniospora]
MGVNGLWTIVQPCARPTNLATLNRKRLAVDASIWIYQFLKAVRDKDGNALRNSHIVGFFRRICKLLWFGILPVFVFDGGAPALKRATIQKRQRRREGRREDAVRTAGKLLALQIQRAAVEEEERRKRGPDGDISVREALLQEEDVPTTSEVVYMDEIGMSQREQTESRRFQKQDAYHLPDLDGSVGSMGRPDDPRIMSVDELEEYARQFHNGEDINLYDFSNIDFDGDFFKSLPAPDRYNILNAARLRSRLRMGLSKDQLDDMFPDRMAFSRFQIERVKERNHLTQRLMLEVGMQGTDLTLAVNARIAGEKGREYILVKNEGVEGGWALGVVSKEKDVGEAHKPIDVDAIQVQYQSKDDDEDGDDDKMFEDVPLEGVNRLPKPKTATGASDSSGQFMAAPRQQYHNDRAGRPMESADQGEGSLFVDDNPGEIARTPPNHALHPEEEDDVARAIALSLMNQHELDQDLAGEEVSEDRPAAAPEWEQKPVEKSKPILGSSGSIIAHVVNNRANAAVPRRKEVLGSADSDSEDDLQAILARSRKQQPKTVPSKMALEDKNTFGGPLPFPKLDWGKSLFAGQTTADKETKISEPADSTTTVLPEDHLAGGFEVEPQDQDAPKPLPPWMVDETDIRESLKKQQDAEREMNAADRQKAEEEEERRRRELRDQMIEIGSDSEDGSDLEVTEVAPFLQPQVAKPTMAVDADVEKDNRLESTGAEDSGQEPEQRLGNVEMAETAPMERAESASSPEPEFEDLPLSATPLSSSAESPLFMDAPAAQAQARQQVSVQEDDTFAEVEYEDFSDAEDEGLMLQMAEEAEEHARFASELNQKSAAENKEEYEKELRALRSQQSKDRRDADEVTQVMVTECQALLRLFGIPYITAPMEAEAQCAELVKLGIVDGIVTDDSDTFLFGGTRVYKNMFNSNKFVECYLGDDLEQELSLSRQQLISLAQLLGSDYAEGLAGVGPVTAVEILAEFPGKDGLGAFREWWTAVQSQQRPKEADVSSPFRRKFRKSQATKLFLPPGFPDAVVDDAYLHPEVDDSAEPFQWGVPNLEGLRQFLMSTIGWSKERTDEVLVPVIRDMNRRGVEGTQSNITRYFGGGVGVGAKEAFAPRQKAKGSKRMAQAVDKLRGRAADADADEPLRESTKRRRTKAGSRS